MESIVYSNLRDIDGRAIGIRCRGPRIEAVEPGLTAPDAVDCGGRLVLPAFVEPHVHLDKTLWGEDWVPGPRVETLRDYIENERRVLSANKTPPEVRAGRLLSEMLRHGTTAVRSHVDIAPAIGLAHVEPAHGTRGGLARARRRMRPRGGPAWRGGEPSTSS